MSWMFKNWYGAGKWLRYEEYTNDKNRKDINDSNKHNRIESACNKRGEYKWNVQRKNYSICWYKEKRIYALKNVNMK